MRSLAFPIVLNHIPILDLTLLIFTKSSQETNDNFMKKFYFWCCLSLRLSVIYMVGLCRDGVGVAVKFRSLGWGDYHEHL